MIAAAAINFYGEIITLPPPARHHDLIKRIVKLYPDDKRSILPSHQGFVDDCGVFMDRKSAAIVACISGQIEDKDIHSMGLFSEDLW